jgi:hypothetical protein
VVGDIISTCNLNNLLNSVAEIPTKDSNLPQLPHLASLHEKFSEVDDQSETTDARSLWNERLQVCHQGNGRRLRELYATHGFYIKMTDYILPGTIVLFLFNF